MDIEKSVIKKNRGKIPSGSSEIYITADLGATNLRLAMTQVRDGNVEILFENDYSSAELNNPSNNLRFIDAYEHFLREGTEYIGRKDFASAALALAGPVDKKSAPYLTQCPNIIVDPSQFSQIYSSLKMEDMPLMLMNDFGAVGWALPGIDIHNKSQVLRLNKGKLKDDNRKYASIGAGTGLGSVLTVLQGNLPDISINLIPNEGGHTGDIGARKGIEGVISDLIYGYREIEEAKKGNSFGNLEMEDYVSGRGMGNILKAYRDLAVMDWGRISDNYKLKELSTGIQLEFQAIKAEYELHMETYEGIFKKLDELDKNGRLQDSGQLIGDNLGKGLVLLDKTMELFFSLYGKAVRSSIMAYTPDIFFVSGGIAPRYLNSKKGNIYMEKFREGLYVNGTNEEVTRGTPVYLIKDKNLSIKGATYAAQHLASSS